MHKISAIYHIVIAVSGSAPILFAAMTTTTTTSSLRNSHLRLTHTNSSFASLSFDIGAPAKRCEFGPVAGELTRSITWLLGAGAASVSFVVVVVGRAFLPFERAQR